MPDIREHPTATAAGTFDIGGELTVNRLGFGAMRLTGEGSGASRAIRDECRRVLRRAVELGVNFIDTADSYGPYVSERLIAEALHPYPDDLVIATKGGLDAHRPGPVAPDGRPEHLREACEGSLRAPAARADRPLPAAPHRPEGAAGGIVRRAGASCATRARSGTSASPNVSVEQLRRGAGDRRRSSSVQNRYNLADRDRRGRARGVRARAGSRSSRGIRWRPGSSRSRAARSRPIAERHDATPAQIALAWLLQRSPVMLPIPGTSTVAHLEENVAAAGVALSTAEIAEIEALVAQDG